MQSLLFWLGTCFERISPKEWPQIPLFLIYVNDMLLQKMENGSLLQFADYTCLICYGDHTHIKDFLSSDLDSLALWIATSKMQVNVEKSHVDVVFC